MIEVKIEGHGVFKENVEEPDQMPFENVHAEVGFGDPPANVEFRRLFARSLNGNSLYLSEYSDLFRIALQYIVELQSRHLPVSYHFEICLEGCSTPKF